jgi:cell division protein FtsI (penicillin-binding protein 3)
VASFIGIAPADKPRFVVAVALTDPRNGRFGSLLGGPVFKEVMTYVLQKWRVAPSGAKAPALPTTWK